MAFDYDVIVVGSGFGGAVTACRMAERGYKVVVLERGRRWEPKYYPRSPGDAWIWDQYHPDKYNGWIDFRVFPRMAVVQGAGVGGGSLIYANVSVNAKPDSFKVGWPAEITYQELKPYYDLVGGMLDSRPLPPNQWTARTRLVKEAAEKLGYGDRFEPLELAVSFDNRWSYDLDDPHDPKWSKTFVNVHGKKQGTCIHLGNCDIGCDMQAKNTLDLNYIARAETLGAQIRPLHLVRNLSPHGGGYQVHYDEIEDRSIRPGSLTGRIVVLSAGSLGSTELLLRCVRKYKTLPRVSPFLGKNWSSNGDFLTPAFQGQRKLSPTRGPTISASIDFLDERNLEGHHFFIEDGGMPDVVENYLEAQVQRRAWSPRARALRKTLEHVMGQSDHLSSLMPWFAQARDAANGTLVLGKQFFFFGQSRLFLRWNPRQSEAVINAVAQMHKRLAETTGGKPLVPLTWTLLKYLVTPHPLGGCNMGVSWNNGVVDHKGEVFGYKNLYVADGANVPEAIGLNPSKTIAALAERIAKLMADEGR